MNNIPTPTSRLLPETAKRVTSLRARFNVHNPQVRLQEAIKKYRQGPTQQRKSVTTDIDARISTLLEAIKPYTVSRNRFISSILELYCKEYVAGYTDNR